MENASSKTNMDRLHITKSGQPYHIGVKYVACKKNEMGISRVESTMVTATYGAKHRHKRSERFDEDVGYK